MNPELPIGLFDSGVGGLTVLKAIRQLLPSENLLYLGDTARVPYGTKSKQTITKYTLKAAQTLVDLGVKMLVIACNTATSAALPVIAAEFAPIPVLGVVQPGASAAVKATQNHHIAVIATEATINEGAYQTAIGELAPNCKVVTRSCTLLVSLAEEGWLDGDPAECTARRYLQDIFLAQERNPDKMPDTLLLGCTHFPLFRNLLEKMLGSQVKIVDSAVATAQATQAILADRSLLNPGPAPGAYRLCTTDNAARFARTGSLFLGVELRPQDIQLLDL